jgi:hypothetical protein
VIDYRDDDIDELDGQEEAKRNGQWEEVLLNVDVEVPNDSGVGIQVGHNSQRVSGVAHMRHCGRPNEGWLSVSTGLGCE